MLRWWCFVLLFCAPVIPYSQDWLQRPYTEWLPEQIDRVLNNSPWVGSCVAEQTRGQFEALQATGLLPTPRIWRVRLLTARPVREALLAEMSFAMDLRAAGKVVDKETLKAGEPMPSREDTLKEILRSRPDDIRVKGDDEAVVIALTITQFVQSWVAAQYDIGRYARNGSERNATVVGEDTRRMPSDWMEEYRPERLAGLSTSDLAGKTFLLTRTGKKAQLLRYEPPGDDLLGAKFYFPRKLSDGTLLATEADKELQFETIIRGKKVKVRFDLNKLVYKGKLEI